MEQYVERKHISTESYFEDLKLLSERCRTRRTRQYLPSRDWLERPETIDFELSKPWSDVEGFVIRAKEA